MKPNYHVEGENIVCNNCGWEVKIENLKRFLISTCCNCFDVFEPNPIDAELPENAERRCGMGGIFTKEELEEKAKYLSDVLPEIFNDDVDVIISSHLELWERDAKYQQCLKDVYQGVYEGKANCKNIRDVVETYCPWLFEENKGGAEFNGDNKMPV